MQGLVIPDDEAFFMRGDFPAHARRNALSARARTFLIFDDS
jgi:hypothetical protein